MLSVQNSWPILPITSYQSRLPIGCLAINQHTWESDPIVSLNATKKGRPRRNKQTISWVDSPDSRRGKGSVGLDRNRLQQIPPRLQTSCESRVDPAGHQSPPPRAARRCSRSSRCKKGTSSTEHVDTRTRPGGCRLSRRATQCPRSGNYGNSRQARATAAHKTNSLRRYQLRHQMRC